MVLPPERSLLIRTLLSAPHSLTLVECLSLVIGDDAVAHSLLLALGTDPFTGDSSSVLDVLAEQAELGEYSLPSVPGIDEIHRTRLLAALALSRKLFSLHEQKRLRRPVDGAIAFSESLRCVPHEYRLESREWMGVVILDATGAYSPLLLVARGVRNHVNLSPADLFRPLLAQRARGFALYHNHPSGNCLPSPTDLDLTELVLELSLTFGIAFLGHGIVGPGSEHWIDGREFLDGRERRKRSARGGRNQA